MIRIPGRIPIIIHPAFWIFALIIGFLNAGGDLIATLIWVGIIFVSVLFHEFGHALTALTFGRKPRIELVALGGLTYHDGSQLKFWKQFIIVLNGPLFGFLLVVFATILLSIPGLLQNHNAIAVVRLFQIVNLFWTVVNLLPVMPLDGGQLLRIVLEGIFGAKGIKYAMATSTIISLGVSLACFLFQMFLIGALFFLFAYQGYETWRRTKNITAIDEKESLKKAFEEGETAFQKGQKEQAITIFEGIRNEAKKGMLFVLATQYLAFLKYEKGEFQEAFDLLVPIKSELSGDSLGLFHRLAFELKNYPLVVELSGSSYQIIPTIETALRNATASAALGQTTPAIGWLETAHQEGLENIEEVIKDPVFDSVRNDSAFKQFIEKIKNET